MSPSRHHRAFARRSVEGTRVSRSFASLVRHQLSVVSSDRALTWIEAGYQGDPVDRLPYRAFGRLLGVPHQNVSEHCLAGRFPSDLQRDCGPGRAVPVQRADRVHWGWLYPWPRWVARAAHRDKRRGIAPSGGNDARHGAVHRCRKRRFCRGQAQPRAAGTAAADRFAADDRAGLLVGSDCVPLARYFGNGITVGAACPDGCGARQTRGDEPGSAGGHT
jgi:hypothetical protein